jgi:hypothetical protein
VESAERRQRRRQRKPRRRSNSVRLDFSCQGGFPMAVKKKSKKAGKAAKKRSYYLGKEIRACRSR